MNKLTAFGLEQVFGIVDEVIPIRTPTMTPKNQRRLRACLEGKGVIIRENAKIPNEITFEYVDLYSRDIAKAELLLCLQEQGWLE